MHNEVFNSGLTPVVLHQDQVEPQHFFYKVHSSTEVVGSVQEAPSGMVWPDLPEKIGLAGHGDLPCLQIQDPSIVLQGM